MRLSHIKLAGFKSFVDPTHIALPGQLVGVVGPNGCGKSNVIDALRWVLGESKASALRGESMQDVIFNGSVQRKPVARASVELVFDNTLGKAAGQWASYAEISIKRILKRDGDSSYYINNQHVRRKDVTDIFLGTGLGARAYAIIEQGMISRIIEAKPEELRVFLEEAAGVSRYRDRRRETENRLADTRDNLLRVDDVLQELDAQLLRLAEQAEVARRYRALEHQRDTAQQLLWLVKRQEAALQRAKFAQGVEQAQLALEAETARLRASEAQLETARAAHYRQADEVHARQGALYEANAEVLRLEQQIAHLAAQRQRIGQQIASNERLIAQQQAQLQAVKQKQSHWTQEQSAAGGRLGDAEQNAAAEAARLPEFETAAANAQNQFSAVQRERLLRQQQVELAESQRGLLQRATQQLESRRSRLLLEQANLPRPDTATLEHVQLELAALETTRSKQQKDLAELQAQLPQADIARRHLRTAAVQQERVLAQTEARLAALQQLQQKLDTHQALNSWLAKHGLQTAPRLWQALRVAAGWDNALEAVLRERLNAIQLEAGAALPPPAPARVAMYQAGREARVHAAPEGLRPLRSLIECGDTMAQLALNDWLAAVYVADSLEQALAHRDELPTGGSFVTPQGHQVSAHGVAFHAPDNVLHGVLARQREIEQLDGEAQEQRAHLEAARQQASAAERTHADTEAQIAPLRQQVNEAQQHLHGLQMQALKLAQANERSIERAGQIDRELQEIADSLTGELEQQQAVAVQLEAARHALTGFEAQAAQAQRYLGEQDSALRQQRARSQQAQQALQEARYYAKTCADKLTDVAQERQRVEVSLAQIEHDIGLFRAELTALPEAQTQTQVQQALTVRTQREAALAEARNALEQATQALNRLDSERLSCAQRLPPLRDKVAELTLKEQEARLHFEQWAEQLQGVDETALQPLLDNARPAALQGELIRLGSEIEALGAVNLAALEELQAAQQRKTYLDAQAADLRVAMDTLETAIRRIDRESRELLMATYEAVNRNLAELFPVLFAGGEARLVLTGEEILDSGVQVMAQPPGKKNSSIHLLSGGEKALTAISLVFALFQLNPAPFCLLDEVDAPLDDTNTERLCQLIRKMAPHTQFVFISHNKITMELAQQLVGVTMQEKGVSKVVAVDIEEALRMREEA
ncbi:chromosome segregation protein SMC [Ferriphaselus sp. R-1]|uniref:chromosome segregation protein SMC n=1 Tax=Ferriphaselus sp. R-1 TaxID=1485544 RepID=UPI0005549F56|nr:chromosome segregation protein SMC [Ferriphaselus sp. R-1]